MENKRLTTKCDSDEYIVGVTTNGGYDEDAVLEKQYEANNKLGKLEDLEEQLGCPLDVFVKLHKIANVYTTVGKLKVLKILDQFIAVKVNDDTTYLPLSNYKKTWWLKEDKSE